MVPDLTPEPRWSHPILVPKRPLLAVVPNGENNLRLQGELDLSTVDILRLALKKLPGDFTLDMSELSFMDTSGLHAIFDEREGFTITLVGVRPVVMKILDLAGFLDGRHGLIVIPHSEDARD
jgi:anti-anti-sigma factor